MVKYYRTKNDIKTQVRELAIFYLKPILLIGAMAFPFSIYLLIVGYVASEPEALIMGYPALALAVLLLFYVLIGYFYFRKTLLASFEKNVENGKVEYTIHKKDGKIEVTRGANDSFSFSIEDIKKISHTKNNIIVKLKNKALFVFPMQKDILTLFK